MNHNIKNNETIAFDFAKSCKSRDFGSILQLVNNIYNSDRTEPTPIGHLTKQCCDTFGYDNTLRIAMKMCSMRGGHPKFKELVNNVIQKSKDINIANATKGVNTAIKAIGFAAEITPLITDLLNVFKDEKNTNIDKTIALLRFLKHDNIIKHMSNPTVILALKTVDNIVNLQTLLNDAVLTPEMRATVDTLFPKLQK